mgnify:CR=1 FL=1
MHSLHKVRNPGQITAVADLAREIWTRHFVPIIGQAQVEYMLEAFQSEGAIAGQLAEGYEYYLMTREKQPVGYLAIVPDAGRGTLMLSKIYVQAAMRGRGCGRHMLAFAENACRERGIGTLWLTVNKNNTQAIEWYRRMGFRVAEETVVDIGGGFVMDDYRMEKAISIRPLQTSGPPGARPD